MTLTKNQCRIVILTLILMLISFNFELTAGAESEGKDELYFTILHTNDEHSALIPHSSVLDYKPDTDNPSIGGISRLAAAVTEIRTLKEELQEPVLLISAGDFYGGTPFSWLALEGETPELALMQEIGYDIITIGNHEYDFGPELLADYLTAAGYPDAHEKTAILSSNTLPPENHPLAAINIKKTMIVDLENGLKLGFFGLMGEDAQEVAANTGDIIFSNQYETAKASVEDLNAQGADIIIAVTHSGIEEDRILAENATGIDLIIGGHSHTVLTEPVTVGNTIILQTGTLMEYLGMAEIAYNTETDSISLRNSREGNPYLIEVADYPPAREINILLAEYTKKTNQFISRFTGERFNSIYDVVGRSDMDIPNKPALKETPFANLITDAMRIVTSDIINEPVDFAFYFNGQIRGGIEPADMPYAKGLISFYDLAELVGLGRGLDESPGYSVVSFYLTGEEVRRVLEVTALLEKLKGDTYFLQVSGLRYDYDPERSILLQIPILDLPIPTTKAVLKAERFTAPESQSANINSDAYVPLERGDTALYRVVTDHYILSFLPLAGEMLPKLAIVPRSRNGEPIENLDTTVVKHEGRELKVWEVLAEYVAGQPAGDNGVPELPSYYGNTSGRTNKVDTVPLIVWPAVILLVIAAVIIYLLRRRKLTKYYHHGKPVS